MRRAVRSECSGWNITRWGVRADYGATRNLGAPAATNLLPLRGAFAAAPPALQQQPLIKLALLTSAAAQQLICSVWTNKHNNTSQWSCRMARTPSSCLGPGRSRLLGRLATLAQKRQSASCFWKCNKSSPGNVGLKKKRLNITDCSGLRSRVMFGSELDYVCNPDQDHYQDNDQHLEQTH